MRKSFLITKQLQVQEVISGPKSSKLLQRPQKISKQDVETLDTDLNNSTPQRQLFQSLSYKNLEPAKNPKEFVQLSYEELISRIKQIKNPIQRQKALLKLQRKGSILKKTIAAKTTVTKTTVCQPSAQKGLKRIMTLKDLKQIQKKNEIKKLQTLLAPTMRVRTQYGE